MDYTHPREGTETLLVWCKDISYRDYTHPREGTETLLSSARTLSARWIILIPARGRKRSGERNALRNRERLYSSPRGDGNLVMYLLYHVRYKIILIPARGRKHYILRYPAHWPIDYTHPREGTETWHTISSSSAVTDYTHPREGTETACREMLLACDYDYTHPREGTETA